MTVSADRTLFDELASSITGLRGAYSEYSSKDDNQRNKIISKALAAACAAGLIGSVMAFSGTVAFLLTFPLAVSHFTKEHDSAHFSLFEELGDGLVDTLTLTSFKRFFSAKSEDSLLPSSLEEALTKKYLSRLYSTFRENEKPLIIAKTVLVAIGAGIGAKILGCFSPSILLVASAFALARYTRLADRALSDSSVPPPVSVEPAEEVSPQ